MLAGNLARRGVHVAGLVLQSAFLSLHEAARHLVGAVGGMIVGQQWDNETQLREVQCPVLLIHGRRDEIIPYTHAKRLHVAAAKVPGEFKLMHLPLEADHDNFCSHADIVIPLQRLLRLVGEARHRLGPPVGWVFTCGVGCAFLDASA